MITRNRPPFKREASASKRVCNGLNHIQGCPFATFLGQVWHMNLFFKKDLLIGDYPLHWKGNSLSKVQKGQTLALTRLQGFPQRVFDLPPRCLGPKAAAVELQLMASGRAQRSAGLVPWDLLQTWVWVKIKPPDRRF